MKTQSTAVALIPARSGSKRLPDKNIRRLGQHPLLAYSISAAKQSGIFADIFVSTDSEKYAAIARHYGANVPFLRPAKMASDLSPDIEWISNLLERLHFDGREYDCFSILRPTSPFRSGETIRRAWGAFLTEEGIDSLRAVEKATQHPGKMWRIEDKRMIPLLPQINAGQPMHSNPYASLPAVYVQNASLEIAWTRVVFEQGTIAGEVLMPFFTQGYEGFDLNYLYDWHYAEYLLENSEVALPAVSQTPYPA